jgi:hypothetical protein
VDRKESPNGGDAAVGRVSAELVTKAAWALKAEAGDGLGETTPIFTYERAVRRILEVVGLAVAPADTRR